MEQKLDRYTALISAIYMPPVFFTASLEAEGATYIPFSQQSHPDIQVLFLWIALLVQCTVKTYIKQGANKPNYGRLVGKGSGGLWLWCGFCTHKPCTQRLLQECLAASAFYWTHYDA